MSEPCKFREWLDERKRSPAPAPPPEPFAATSIEQVLAVIHAAMPPECWCATCMAAKFLNGDPCVSGAVLCEDTVGYPRPLGTQDLLEPGSLPAGASVYLFRVERDLVPWSLAPDLEARIERALGRP